MSFLNSDRLSGLLPTCIEPFNSSHIESGAYELSLGDEYFTTDSKKAVKQTLKKGGQLVIEPGHFALLITKEKIEIPADNLGFISIKAGVKFRGLINVSGFHVDPGFKGKLKFSVYNAGSRDIILTEGQRLFPMWLGEFNSSLKPAQVYHGKFQNQDTITSENISNISGKIFSPAVLGERIKGLDNSFSGVKIYLAVITTLFAGIVARFVFTEYDSARWKDIEIQQAAINKKLTKLDSILQSNIKDPSINPAFTESKSVATPQRSQEK